MRISENDPKDYMNEQEAIKTLKIVTDLLDNEKLEYWLDYGTLLGAIREGRFIPWDTDIEIYVKYYENDGQRFIKFLENLRKGHNIKLKHHVENQIVDMHREGLVGVSLGFFVLPKRTKYTSWFLYYIPFRKGIIRFMQRFYFSSTSEFVRPDDGNVRDQTWHCRIIRSFLPTFFAGKLKKIRFYDLDVSVPAKAEELLLLRYGKDWRTPKKVYESYTT